MRANPGAGWRLLLRWSEALWLWSLTFSFAAKSLIIIVRPWSGCCFVAAASNSGRAEACLRRQARPLHCIAGVKSGGYLRRWPEVRHYKPDSSSLPPCLDGAQRAAPLRSSGFGVLRFQGFYFAQATHVAFFVCEFCAEERFYEILGQHWADDPRAEHQHIDVVVLHTLMRGIGIVTHAGTDTGQFVGGDAGADATAADEHAALGLVVEDRAADRFREIGIVRRVLVEGADVEHFVAQRAQQIARGYFQLKSRVVRANHDFHGRFPRASLAVAITLSARKPNFLSTSFSGAEAPNVCMPILLPLGPT